MIIEGLIPPPQTHTPSSYEGMLTATMGKPDSLLQADMADGMQIATVDLWELCFCNSPIHAPVLKLNHIATLCVNVLQIDKENCAQRICHLPEIQLWHLSSSCPNWSQRNQDWPGCTRTSFCPSYVGFIDQHWGLKREPFYAEGEGVVQEASLWDCDTRKKQDMLLQCPVDRLLCGERPRAEEGWP